MDTKTETKINKIREYFIKNKIINEDSCINVDFLGEEPTEFAIMPIPVNPIVKKYITGQSYRQFVFQLISRNFYSADVMQNISNSAFYEKLCELIELNNKKRILPDIDGIDKIECLDNGAILNTTTNTAQYSIQMRILYFKEAI